MKLHEYQDEFRDLISIVANKLHIPESAVERDYYIVLLLKNLENSEYADKCVFKGGTSLSKCYPGSIERFSEDIDLTFLGMELSDKVCDKNIKKIETIMTEGAQTEKIGAERFPRTKSMYVWFLNDDNKIKLEIGSSVRPDPYSKKTFKSYIHEFLEEQGADDDIQKFELAAVTLNVLEPPPIVRMISPVLNIVSIRIAISIFPLSLLAVIAVLWTVATVTEFGAIPPYRVTHTFPRFLCRSSGIQASLQTPLVLRSTQLVRLCNTFGILPNTSP